MKKYSHCSVMLVVVLLMLACGRAPDSEIISEFHTARYAGDLKQICQKVRILFKRKRLYMGMSSDQMSKILGPFDTGTGIYGHFISGGYGKPNSVKQSEIIKGVVARDGSNYNFVWFHFDLSTNEKTKKETLILKDWDKDCE